MTTTPVFRAENITYSQSGLSLIDGCSFAASEGEALIIGGRSGCGKSTLLHLCAWLLRPQAGEVFWEGKCIGLLNRDELVNARRRIGFVFQEHALIHNFTIYDTIALPLRYHSTLTEKEIRSKVKRRMDEVGLFNVDRRFPNELSLGQAKSAALARALILDPVILFADEPTAGVDPYTETCIANVINSLRNENKLAIVMTCNSIQTIRLMKSPLRILENGKLFRLSDTEAGADEYRPAILTTFQELL